MASELTQSLPDSWEVRRLDEVASIIDSLHKTPTYSEVGGSMVRVTDVQGGFLDLTKTLRVTEDVFQEFTRRYTPKRGDIVFSRVGSYGNASYAKIDTPFCLGQNTALISPRINGRFLHLFLQSEEARWQIEQVVVGSTQKTISLKSISAIQIPIPPPQELAAIAHILGTLDDKIELNRGMNETLEAAARAIFKSWFVDFDPVRAKLNGQKPPAMDEKTAALFPDAFEESELGEIPKGWRVETVGEVCIFNYGKALKASDRRSGEVPVYGSNGIVGSHDEAIASGPGIVVGRKGNPGIVTWAPIDFFPIDTTFFVSTLSEDVSLSYLRYALEYCRMDTHGSDSAVPGLNRNMAYGLPLVVPDPMVVRVFDQIFLLHQATIHEFDKESRALAQLRDTLLPKLLSGELRVPDAETTIKEAI